MNKLSKRSRSRINEIEGVLIQIIEAGISDCPYDFGVPEFGGKRTDREQEIMYSFGRTTFELQKKGITGLDGQPKRNKVTWTLNSYHESGKAFDIYAYVNGGASWDMKYLEPIARHLQKVALERFCVTLEWGFDLWGKDGAHFQIK
jgi:hypothetical protein